MIEGLLIAAEIVSYMQGYNDPRLENITQGKYQDDTGILSGLRIGILPSKVMDDERYKPIPTV